MKLPISIWFDRKKGRRGIALIVTLFIVVLLTVVLVTFFTRSLANRQISSASVESLQADLMGRAAADFVIGEIREEMANPSNNLRVLERGGRLLLQPDPARPETAAPALKGETGTGRSIVKVSSSGESVRPGGTAVASTVALSTKSANGWYISAERWYGDRGPRVGDSGAAAPALPSWMYYTRGNGVAVPGISDAKNRQSASYAMGRFAYTVYDLGDLIDVNVAGYPAAASAQAATKGSAAFADLEVISPGLSGVVSAWRNATTGGNATLFQEWATGLKRDSSSSNRAALEAARSGHQYAVAGDNAVLSRRDLLRNPHLQEPGYLTHFSRTRNAPSWMPVTNGGPGAGAEFQYQTKADESTSANRAVAGVTFGATGSITHYRDDGATETLETPEGGAVLGRRFSLARLAWLGPAGPNTDAFSGSGVDPAEAIRACFGLQWDNDNARWEYVEIGASNKIKTLKEVSDENREPNFFEVLKAGILSGSIGKKSDNKTLAGTTQRNLDEIPDLQIIRIGANIIDCADTDNFPTTIAFDALGTKVPIHGLEDLPYLFALSSAQFNQNQGVGTGRERMLWCKVVSAPFLFNPNQASGAVITGGPAAIRVRVAQGTLSKLELSGPQNVPDSLAVLLARTPNKDMSSAIPIELPSGSFGNFRGQVKAINNSDNPASATSLETVAAPYTQAVFGKYHGFLLYDYDQLPKEYNVPTYPATLAATMSNYFVVLEFKDAAGNWRIYDRIAGNEAFTTNNGLNGPARTNLSSTINLCLTFDPSANQTHVSIGFGASKLDPRTSRYGILQNSNLGIQATNAISPSIGAYTSGLPFGAESGSSVYPGDFVEGGKVSWTGTSPSNVADPDNVARPGDAWRNGATANLYKNLTDASRRAVVLQRPFRSVAELGYVFRDTPGKTLSFFDGTSGDAALLDLFSVSDTAPVVAGTSNLVSRQARVTAALLSKTSLNLTGTSTISAANAQTLGEELGTYAQSSGAPTDKYPLTVAQLANFIENATGGNLGDLKNNREAVARALGGSTQTRTWNLLIDVIAQVGKFAPAAGSLEDFTVDGQRRFWVSVAIDRYTGEVVARQLEPVNE